jgi:D-alanyl-lipoteichoic acid acyltransferase DltB (MBOAT superfamily)
LREGLFFLIINPTLVYSARGEKVSGMNLSFSSWGRVLLGVGSIAVCLVMRTIVMTNSVSQHIFLAPPIATFLLVFSEYFCQSGRASVEIGLMRSIGWKVPERYRLPFLSKSPADFWRRWNIYIGLWAKIYVFVPLSKSIEKFTGKMSRTLIVSLSAIVTFVFIGAYHDLCLALRNPEAYIGGGSFIFLLNALALISWRQITKRLSTWVPDIFLNRQSLRVLTSVFSCMLCMTFLFSFGAFAFPLTLGKMSISQMLWKIIG